MVFICVPRGRFRSLINSAEKISIVSFRIYDYGGWSPQVEVTISGADVAPSIFVDISSKLEC